MSANRVLIASPVKQKRAILAEFLRSLSELDVEGLSADFLFVDDNEAAESSSLLREFRPMGGAVTVWAGGGLGAGSADGVSYVCDDQTHRWNERLIWKVAAYKDRMIEEAKGKGYDFLFLVDSDLVLHPATLRHLISCDRPIVSEVFWTRWQPSSEPLPQVWLRDQYTLFEHARGERLSQDEARRRARAFLERLKAPGLHEVGGLGACTLIARQALDAGVSFAEIPNLSFWGEDRHFCVRAAALGLKLYVDTCCPAFHIYRESDLARVARYRDEVARARWPAAHGGGGGSGGGAATVGRGRASGAGVVSREDHEILRVVKEAVERFWSFDFRSPKGLDGVELFTPDYRDAILKGFDADLAASVQAQLISRTEVLRASIAEVDGDGMAAVVRASVLTHGAERGRYFREVHECDVFVTRVAATPGVGAGPAPGAASGAALATWLVGGVEFRKAPQQPELPEFVKARTVKFEGNRLTLSMLVRNEAGRYLRRVLEHAARYVDDAVILDDASEDDTVEVCREVLGGCGVPVTIVSNPEPGFGNEVRLRKQQWDLVASTNPDWILTLDADEMLEDKAASVIRGLINQPFYDHYSFRLYDFWSPTHYREDPYWQAHRTYRILLVRYQPGFAYAWRETPLHCGRLPDNVSLLPGALTELRAKHFGWATQGDREAKYRRYKALDPGARYGIREQYESILDPRPNLVEWVE